MTYLEYIIRNCVKYSDDMVTSLLSYIQDFQIDENGIVKKESSSYRGLGVWDLFMIDESDWTFAKAKIPDFIKEIFPFLKSYRTARYITKDRHHLYSVIYYK